MKHEWIFVFHTFGDFPPAIAPLLKHTIKVPLDKPCTIVPAEKRMMVGEETHWGFWNQKPAQTYVLIHKLH